MRQLLFCLFLCFFLLPAYGQKLYPLKVEEDSVSFGITVKDRAITVEPTGTSDLFKSLKDFPTMLALRLEEADLVLEYQRPDNAEDVLSYSIELSLRLPDGQLIRPKLEEISTAPAPGVAFTPRLVWLDATEQINDFSGVYVVYVRRSLMGAVNCEGLRPEFTWKKKSLHYTAAAAGLALVGLGQVYRAQKKDYYDTYRRLWQEGRPAPGADDNALEKARGKDKSSKICTWTGAGILAADALLLTYRHFKIRRKQQVYDRFCGKKTSLLLLPSLQFPGSVAFAAPAPGFSVLFSF